MAWQKDKPAGTDALKNSDDDLRANNVEIELRRLFNLCPNAAFLSRSAGTAAVPDEWSLESTPTVAYDTVDAGYGDFAVKLTASGATDEGIKITLTNLKVSTKYQVFVRTKVTAGDTSSIITTGATTNINVDSTSTSWETKIGEFVTDASATDVVLKLVASADGDIVWFCGITCVEGDIPPTNFIRRENEVFYLKVPVTDTSYDGDVFSTVNATLDLSAFGNGCPAKIKAVLLTVQISDSGSAAGNPLIMIGPAAPGGDWMKSALAIGLAGETDTKIKSDSAWVPCDANGDIFYDLDASGAGTLDLRIIVWGWVLP